jgi:hypothetical protein
MTASNHALHPICCNAGIVAADDAPATENAHPEAWRDDGTICFGCGELEANCTCPDLDECPCVHLADCGDYPGDFDYVPDADCPICGGYGVLRS